MTPAWRKPMSSCAYAGVLLIVGLPVWWKTTEVYRAELPYSDIEQLETLSLRQKVVVQLVTSDETHTRGPDLQKALLRDSDAYHITLTVRRSRSDEERAAEEAATLGELDDRVGGALSGLAGGVVVMEVPGRLFNTTAGKAVTVGRHRVVYASPTSDMELVAAIVRNTVLGEFSLKERRKSVVSAADKLDIFLCLLVPQPDLVMASWDVETAVKNHLQPFVDTIDMAVNVTVKSQVLYLTALDLGEGGHATLGPEQLSLAVNPVESGLASQSSRSPALHLLVYVPTVHVSPVTIAGSETNSFLVPGWGGVTVYNYEEASEAKFPLHVDIDMDRVMAIFVGQLRALLGFKDLGDGLALAPPRNGIASWERDLLLRQRSWENILEVSSTLRSLSQLLSQIPNIVINDDIATKVTEAVREISASSVKLGDGFLDEGFKSGKTARKEAEDGFLRPVPTRPVVLS